ncbi:MAG: hypothetical protein J4O03_13065, partial [Chloroflexi bacterium]|nr:hypothetical protein [Chloroflexota bacterium]
DCRSGCVSTAAMGRLLMEVFRRCRAKVTGRPSGERLPRVDLRTAVETFANALTGLGRDGAPAGPVGGTASGERSASLRNRSGASAMASASEPSRTVSDAGRRRRAEETARRKGEWARKADLRTTVETFLNAPMER